MTAATPKRKRKVVVWAVVSEEGTVRPGDGFPERAMAVSRATTYPPSFGAFRVVRCTGEVTT